MEPVSEALSLLKRKAEIQSAMREPGGVRVTAERELFAINENLAKFPVAVNAILEASRELKRPVEVMSVVDVERFGEARH